MFSCACSLLHPTSRLSDPAPLMYGLQPRRFRGVRCSRLVRPWNSHKISRISGRPRRACSDSRPRHCARNVTAQHAKYTKRNPRFFCVLTPGFRIQQEVTEKTEGGVRLRSLRCLRFNPPRVAHRRACSDRHWRAGLSVKGACELQARTERRRRAAVPWSALSSPLKNCRFCRRRGNEAHFSLANRNYFRASLRRLLLF